MRLLNKYGSIIILFIIGNYPLTAQHRATKLNKFHFYPYENEVIDKDSSHLSVNPSATFKEPVVYTSVLLASEFGILLVTGMADHYPHISRFKDGFTKGPKPDDDHWIFNHVLHPLQGSETYLRARENHFGWFGSFLFSTAASLVWEFLIESWTERPSTQDLWITSTVGSLIGEFRYYLKKKIHKRYHWIIDPIYSLYTYLFYPKSGNP